MVEALVQVERVRALHERLGISQLTVAVNSVIVGTVFWDRAGPGRIVPWVAIVWSIAAVRLALGAAYRKAEPDPAATARWLRIFTAGVAVNGIAWGASPLLLVGDGLPVAYAIVLAFVLGGMTAGAALSNASHQPAFLAFAVPALLPISVLLLAGGDLLHVAMGLLLLVFGGGVSAISRSGGRALGEAVRLRFRNAELAEGLSAAAAELESRVVERTSKLEAALAREREAERRLAHAARLASLGTLAAGVAHEINNPLAYVRSGLGYLREELAAGGLDAARSEAALEVVKEASLGADRVREIVRQLSDLARVELRGGLVPVDLDATLDTCVDMVGPELRLRAQVRRIRAPIPEVQGDPTRLVQLFVNLLLNAAEALPEGRPGEGLVTITTRHDEAAGEVLVEVSDSGAGIPEVVQAEVWAPFFTTRASDGHAGLGLAICKGVVASLGGRITLASREGAGATFTVAFRTSGPLALKPRP